MKRVVVFLISILFICTMLFVFRVYLTPENSKKISDKLNQATISYSNLGKNIKPYMVTVTADNKIYYECNIERSFFNITPCYEIKKVGEAFTRTFKLL